MDPGSSCAPPEPSSSPHAVRRSPSVAKTAKSFFIDTTLWGRLPILWIIYRPPWGKLLLCSPASEGCAARRRGDRSQSWPLRDSQARERTDRVDGDQLMVGSMTAAAVGEIAARERIGPHELTSMTHSLEDVFLPVLQAGEDSSDGASPEGGVVEVGYHACYLRLLAGEIGVVLLTSASTVMSSGCVSLTVRSITRCSSCNVDGAPPTQRPFHAPMRSSASLPLRRAGAGRTSLYLCC
jgi:hypothetical protein